MCFVICHVTQPLIISRGDPEHGFDSPVGSLGFIVFLFLCLFIFRGGFWGIVYPRDNRNNLILFIRLFCFLSLFVFFGLFCFVWLLCLVRCQWFRFGFARRIPSLFLFCCFIFQPFQV